MKIELHAVTKQYGKVIALDKVSLEIPAGKLVAILGSNGAGKTTLLRSLSGIVGADSGQLLFDNEPFTRDNVSLRKRMFFLPDFPVVFPGMTLLQHLGMVLKAYEREDSRPETSVISLLKEFDLLPLAKTPLFQLSRGQLYKAALVPLVTVNPELWLLDEPFASGMDPHGINSFKKLCRAAVSQGSTIIYTTQILDVVEKFSDLVCILHGGEVRAFDSVENLLQRRDGGLEMLFSSFREEKA